MIKKIFVAIVLFIATSNFAQQKQISLEEAVLLQGRKFGADKLTGFQWIPNTNDYVYFTDSWTKMVSVNALKSNQKEVVTLSEINAALGTNLRNFYGVQWIDSSTILITEKSKYYSYSIPSKSGKQLNRSSSK